MASETLLICVLMLSSVRVINSAESVYNVKCRPAVGVIGQITNIFCSIESQTGNVIINTVVLTRFSENKPSFTFQPYENRVTGDSRFKVESLPSLQLHNTAISDEGGYNYYIRTNLGNFNAQFTINVAAEYTPPIITSEPTVLEDGGAADLYCRASGGYPAGTIHWFDKSNTNWTQNSELQITQGHDGLFTLSSKLSFRSFDTTWGPFRCVVLNYRYEEEGKAVGRDAWFNVKCRPAVGVIGQITHISCSIESQTGNVIISTVALTRFRENKSCFAFQPYENRVTGDSRFKVESLPSLQLHNTAISDEGGYKYYIRTNQGKVNAEFTINVTAEYRSPIITSEPTELEDGGAADLYCRSSGGYPAGTIHWFDQSNTNWTQNSTLQVTQGDDGLFTLSSKLSFRSFDTTWGPFRCVVLNNRYEEEGESTSALGREGDSELISRTRLYIIICSVGVIALLVSAFLIVLLLMRRCRQQNCSRNPDGAEEEKAMNRVAYARAADAEETVTVIPNNTI